jgi:hypothetical protein
MLTLLAFVASCERAAVREYVAPKQTFPHTAAVREEIEQAQNSAPTHAISLRTLHIGNDSLRRRCGRPALSSRKQTERRWIFL